VKCFQSAKQAVKESLRFAGSRLHLSFDLWTSSNYKAILAIVGHWTNSEYKKETATLGMRELLREHGGVDMAPLLYEVAKEYEIEDKLGWFMTDNVGSNNTALRALDEILQEEGFEGFNPEERRLRCLGHIINLTVKLLLFNGNVGDLGKEMKQIVANVEEDVPAHLREARIKEWRACGVVGKLHNIIVYIRGSTIRHNDFLS
jgi:hypothetical protein